MGIGEGSFAELAIAPPDKLVPKPTNLTFEQASVVSISGLTALHAVRRREVRAGQRVMVIGAAGGVGSYTVHGALERLAELIEDGKVTPVVDRTYPLHEAPDAIRYLAQGHAAGKVAIRVSDRA